MTAPLFDPFADADTDAFEEGARKRLAARRGEPQDLPDLGQSSYREAVADFVERGDPEFGGGNVRKKAKSINHNPRTMELWRRRGYLVEKVETTRVMYGGAIIVNDLLGIADIVAGKLGGGIVLVQACAAGQLAAHLRKFRDNPWTRILLQFGVPITVTAWEQPGGPGGRWAAYDCQVTEELMDEYEARKR